MKKQKYPSVMKPQDKGYPIKPKDLHTKDEPKGFDALFDYCDRNLLWLFISFCQFKGNWSSFTDADFMDYLSKTAPKNIKDRFMVGHFVGSVLAGLLDRSFVDKENHDYKKGYIYTPTHFIVSTYFIWNPAKILK
jgi:hypothetical protein